MKNKQSDQLIWITIIVSTNSGKVNQMMYPEYENDIRSYVHGVKPSKEYGFFCVKDTTPQSSNSASQEMTSSGTASIKTNKNFIPPYESMFGNVNC